MSGALGRLRREIPRAAAARAEHTSLCVCKSGDDERPAPAQPHRQPADEIDGLSRCLFNLVDQGDRPHVHCMQRQDLRVLIV